MLICSLFPRWHGMGLIITRYILCPRCHGMSLIITCCDAFCVLEGIVGVWSVQVQMHFVFSLALERLVQYELRYIMGSCWHGRVSSTQVEIHFVCPRAWDGFGEYMQR